MIAQASITSQVVEDMQVRDELASTEDLELNENPRFRTLICTDSVGAESVTNRSVAAQGVDNIGVSHRPGTSPEPQSIRRRCRGPESALRQSRLLTSGRAEFSQVTAY